MMVSCFFDPTPTCTASARRRKTVAFALALQRILGKNDEVLAHAFMEWTGSISHWQLLRARSCILCGSGDWCQTLVLRTILTFPWYTMKLPSLFALCVASILNFELAQAQTHSPNILWFVVDDMSANFSCYGDVRSFYPQRPHLQLDAYKNGKTIVKTLRSLHDQNQLSHLSESLLFSPRRPEEELYEWTTDPWQLTNLAADPAHRATLEELRTQLNHWMADTNDHGAESEAMYDSDMKVDLGKGNPTVQKNIAIMKQWGLKEQSKQGELKTP